MFTDQRRFRDHPLVFSTFLLLLATWGPLASAGCGGGDTSLDMEGFGRKYRLADNEISGWTQSTKADALSLFTPETLDEKIDGAASPYIDQGMQFAMYQILVGPDPQDCNLTAMNFPSEDKAQSMVAERKTTMSASLSIPGYASSVASASQALSGITAFASFKDLYVETVLDGFGSDVDAARQVAAKFLQAMEAKTK